MANTPYDLFFEVKLRLNLKAPYLVLFKLFKHQLRFSVLNKCVQRGHILQTRRILLFEDIKIRTFAIILWFLTSE